MQILEIRTSHLLNQPSASILRKFIGFEPIAMVYRVVGFRSSHNTIMGAACRFVSVIREATLQLPDLEIDGHISKLHRIVLAHLDGKIRNIFRINAGDVVLEGDNIRGPCSDSSESF